MTDYETFDDFEPSLESDGPFGRPVGSIPMGTLAEVMGIERAQPLLDILAQHDLEQRKAVARVAGHAALVRY